MDRDLLDPRARLIARSIERSKRRHVACNRNKLDVGIGIGSDTDIRYRHPPLAVSGCRYRMSVSETDTDIQLPIPTSGCRYRVPFRTLTVPDTVTVTDTGIRYRYRNGRTLAVGPARLGGQHRVKSTLISRDCTRGGSLRVVFSDWLVESVGPSWHRLFFCVFSLCFTWKQRSFSCFRTWGYIFHISISLSLSLSLSLFIILSPLSSLSFIPHLSSSPLSLYNLLSCPYILLHA